ncbi:MAG: LPS assembly protein LptD [Candidatus Accumulibacter sp.]|nr:LPS assembly protein LptD [Accumulibacter sp.]
MLLSCGLAGVFAGTCPGEAAAQTPVPLQTADPVLLGTPSGAANERQDAAEVRPIAPEALEVRPVAPRTSPESERAGAADETPTPAAASAPPETREDPERNGADVVRQTGSLPASERAERPAPVEDGETGRPAVREPVSSARSPSYAPAPGERATKTLRVDPALLGLPPSVPARRSAAGDSASAASPSQTRSETAPPPVGEVGEDGKPDPARADGELPDREPEPALRVTAWMDSPPGDDSEPRPVFLSALWMAGEINREFVAEGEAELRKLGSIVNSDLMTYWPLEDEVEAEGSVRLQQADDVMTGPKMRLRLEDRTGHFEQPSYRLKHQSLLGNRKLADREKSSRQIENLINASLWNSGVVTPQTTKSTPFDDGIGLPTTTESRGEAKRIDFEGENQYRLLDNTFTTCPVDNDAWYVRTSELQLDYDHEAAKGRHATVYFKGVPILYSPWLSFSLNNERRSGFLPPSFGTNSDNGFEYEQPYYWNIAPNMDATISPRLMTKRGLQIGSEFRYLNTALGGLYRGNLKAEFLAGDRLRDRDDRHALSLAHDQTTDNGFSGTINFNKVSDDDYYTDLSSNIVSSSQTQLLQQGTLSYGGGWWGASISFQQYQTLQPDENNPVLEQYRMLPQIALNARKLDFHGTDIHLLGQYTRFTIREREQYGTIFPDGNRTVLYPQISLPYTTPGWYVTPKLGVNYRRYSLTGQADGVPGSISVALPVLSLDSGMTFERSSRWFDRDYTQTLEPRLYYLNVPYKDQSDLPLFDTALADFNFAQIFSENQFSGWDRVSNANQLTAALTSRLIEPETGSEIMRATIGQRFHFTRSKVTLSGPAVSGDGKKWDRSDFLAGFSGQILPKVYADTAWQFDLNDRHAERYSIGIRYHPEPGKVLNTAYRYNRETTSPVNQVDVSGQWPLIGRWHGVGRLNYSFKDDGTVLSTSGQGGRIVESIAGLEYDGGCWILRGVVRRQALTSVDASTSFYVQLELSGLGRIGSNPLSLLKRNIQGYGLIGDNDSDTVFND